MLVLAFAAVAASPAFAAQLPSAPRAEAYYLFLQARKLEGDGDVERAIAAYRRAAELAPDSAEIHAELSGLFARQNRIADAMTEGQAALAIDPANREAHRILGFVFGALIEPGQEQSALSLENARKAVAHFEAARGGRASDPGSELSLGRLYVLVGEYDRAAIVLRDFLLEQPGYMEAVLLLSEAQAGKGDTAAAIATLQQAIDAQPGNPRAAMQLADLYEQSGRWTEAAAVYERLAGASPGMAAALNPRRATALVNAGRFDEARAILDKLTAANPADAGLWFLASQTELRAGMLGDAEQAARRIIAIDQADPRGPAALSDVLVARREFPRALEVLQPWIDASAKGDAPIDADEMLLPRASRILGELDHPDRAVEVLERLAKRLPADIDVRFELAAAYERARRHADAERLFREVVLTNPAHALALNYLGYMLADRGERLEEAVSLITRALEIEPDNPSFHDSLGWAYFKLQRYDLAESHLAKAAAGSEDSSLVQDHYGDALFALKRVDGAIAAWQKALAGDRDDVDLTGIEKKIARARQSGR
jgi:tetratricopeptide (TPR) repeat protein